MPARSETEPDLDGLAVLMTDDHALLTPMGASWRTAEFSGGVRGFFAAYPDHRNVLIP